MKSKKINKKAVNKEEILAIFLAICIVFVALLNPMLSVGIALGALITIFIYKFNIN